MNNCFQQSIRVLIVENHQMMLWALCKLISAHRPMMDVVGVVATQADATERIRTATPDLVMMRFELAVLDAQGMLPEALTTECRTLLMLDDTSPEKLGKTVRCGAHGALTRRSNAEEVIKAIEKTHAGELWFGRDIANLVLSELRDAGKPAAARADTSLDRLTPRERKVMDAVIVSRSGPNKSLAKQLFISESTLRNHLSSIYQKLGVSNRLDLYMYAQNCGYSAQADQQVA
jgi:DNA-binding NarL/FixJ family response regulator